VVNVIGIYDSVNVYLVVWVILLLNSLLFSVK
jgi:hypothetical protein